MAPNTRPGRGPTAARARTSHDQRLGFRTDDNRMTGSAARDVLWGVRPGDRWSVIVASPDEAFCWGSVIALATTHNAEVPCATTHNAEVPVACVFQGAGEPPTGPAACGDLPLPRNTQPCRAAAELPRHPRGAIRLRRLRLRRRPAAASLCTICPADVVASWPGHPSELRPRTSVNFVNVTRVKGPAHLVSRPAAVAAAVAFAERSRRCLRLMPASWGAVYLISTAVARSAQPRR